MKKLKRNINILLIISLLSVFFTNCDEDRISDSDEVDCNYCFEKIPDLVNVNLSFNVYKSDMGVAYTIYSGKAFVSKIFYEGYTEENNIWVGVKPDVRYTVVASYKNKDQEVLVVNDFKVETEYLKYACNSACYYIKETRCSLKLSNYP